MKKLVFGLCLLISFGVRAEALYPVEIIVFARDSAEAEHEENWNKLYDLRYPSQTLVLQASDGTGAPYQLLPADAFRLTREAGAIERRRDMRVLVHEAWVQPVDEPARTKAIFICGGKTFGIHHELEGTLALGVEHFLHADVDLWLSRFSANSSDNTQALPLPPGIIVADSNPVNQNAAQTVVLREQRKMRSGELHYFDHPKLGMLVLVTRKPETP